MLSYSHTAPVELQTETVKDRVFLITKEGTWFTWLLGTLWAHIQPPVLCLSFPPWGLCGFPAHNLNCLMALANAQGQQSANMQTMFNNSPGCGREPETPKLCDDSKQTLFIRLQGLCTCIVNKLIILTKEGWTSFDKVQLLQSKALPDKFWGPEQPREELTSTLH